MRLDVQAEPDVDTYEHSKLNGKAPKARPIAVGPQWPKAMEPEAFHGLAGGIVWTIEPHSEADVAGLLVQLLIGLGNAIGRGPHFRAGSDLHYLNLFGVLVGQTSRGRKGSSWSAVSQLLGMVSWWGKRPAGAKVHRGVRFRSCWAWWIRDGQRTAFNRGYRAARALSGP